MNRTERQAKINLYRRELATLEARKPSCTTCEFGDSKGWCRKFEAVPPSDVQADGCENWSCDGVPF